MKGSIIVGAGIVVLLWWMSKHRRCKADFLEVDDEAVWKKEFSSAQKNRLRTLK